MIKKAVRYLYVWFVALVMLIVAGQAASAQTTPPDREKLLNGLSIIFWPRPGDANVLLKLRIHSGAAFDLAGKPGTMSLLADAMFPDAETREYVTEQLGGKLAVTTDYDAINVTISGKATELERMIELIRNAVITPNLSPEAVAKIKDTRLKELGSGPVSSSEFANRAIAARLLGSFPYAQPEMGTAETIGKIDRADLMLADERFLYADNASLAVIGGVEKPRLMRALRQLLGPWHKSDRGVPATFRQPGAPDARVLVINRIPAEGTEIRVAVRGLSRSDRDSLAAQILARIAKERWLAAIPDLSSVSVREDEHALPGIFIFSGRVPRTSAAKAAVSAAREIMNSLAQTTSSATELERARAVIASELNARANETEGLADAALDVDTYKLSSDTQSMNALNRITPADVQRVASRLFKDAPVATVVVGDAEELKTAFGSNVEVRGATAELKNPSSPPVSPPKP
jgi:zinc protease